jgi:hypothetical protein
MIRKWFHRCFVHKHKWEHLHPVNGRDIDRGFFVECCKECGSFRGNHFDGTHFWIHWGNE